MMKVRGGRALDELTGSNEGKIRLLSRAEEKKYIQQRKAKRVKIQSRKSFHITHEMAIEEARNTEVGITRTAQGEDMEMHTSCMALTTDWWVLSWK
jgi:hypothetical protein